MWKRIYACDLLHTFALIINFSLPRYSSSFPASPLALHNFINVTSSSVELQDFNLTSHFIDLAQQIVCKTECWQVCTLVKMFPNAFWKITWTIFTSIYRRFRSSGHLTIVITLHDLINNDLALEIIQITLNTQLRLALSSIYWCSLKPLGHKTQYNLCLSIVSRGPITSPQHIVFTTLIRCMNPRNESTLSLQYILDWHYYLGNLLMGKIIFLHSFVIELSKPSQFKNKSKLSSPFLKPHH